MKKRFNSFSVPVKKFKIQFARMGEPAFNPSVLKALQALKDRYNAPGLLPCVSTIAPHGTDKFFEELLEIKKDMYRDNFQLQFSIHTTDIDIRDKIMPVKKWSFEKIAEYGDKFWDAGGRKITLNFALMKNGSVKPEIIKQYFDTDKYLIKITPINPTFTALENSISPYDDFGSPESYKSIANDFSYKGYEVLISIGELEENQIGSNCGQYIRMNNSKSLKIDGYRYVLQEF